jgi:hypothetical protein
MYYPVTRLQVDVLADHERGRGRIDPQHRQQEQTARRGDNSLPPSVTIQREQDPVADRYICNICPDCDDAADTLIADECRK